MYTLVVSDTNADQNDRPIFTMTMPASVPVSEAGDWLAKHGIERFLSQGYPRETSEFYSSELELLAILTVEDGKIVEV